MVPRIDEQRGTGRPGNEQNEDGQTECGRTDVAQSEVIGQFRNIAGHIGGKEAHG